MGAREETGERLRIIVTGSRLLLNRIIVEHELTQVIAGMAQSLTAVDSSIVIVHGACPSGADRFASEFTRMLQDISPGISLYEERHPADWGTHGRKAGPIRNEEMARLGAALCVAFVMPGQSKGTEDMISRAEKHGIPVRKVVCE